MNVAAAALLALAPAAPLPGHRLTAPALAVSPGRLVLPADRAARPHQLAVTNAGPVGVDVVARVVAFTAGPDGDPVVAADGASPAPDAAWASVAPDRLRIEAETTVRVSLSVTVPARSEPGEHQLAVLFTGPGSATAALILVGVGESADAVEVAGLRAPRFALRGPIELEATLRNAGAVHRDFAGRDRLRAQAGDQVVPFRDFTLLRGSTRHVVGRWANPPLWCICRPTVAVANPDGSTSSATVTVVVLPLHLIALAAALVPMLVGVLVYRSRRGRRHADG